MHCVNYYSYYIYLMLGCLGCRGKHVLQRFHINWLLKCDGVQSQSQKLPQNVANNE